MALLRARLVLPVSRPPLENGAIRIRDNRIEAVGPWPEFSRYPAEEVLDLGETVILPGLINAHCHLDYTSMGGQIPPQKYFADWIKALVALKATWTQADYAQSWRRGAHMLLRSGVTTVVDVEAVPELIPQIWTATPLRIWSMRELISIRSPSSAPEIIEEAVRQWSGLGAEGKSVGLSPHAPYTTSARFLSRAAQAAAGQRWLLTTHVSESEEELQMFLYRQGPLHDWLKSQRDMSDCGHGSPIHHLERCGYLNPNLLAAHVNYLWRDDAQRLAHHRVSVVHCPRSHAYFRHLLFPCQELRQAGVNICLGTDSAASLPKPGRQPPDLNLFAEMQSLSQRHPDLDPAWILKTATLHAAKALGLTGQLGELSPGALADLILLPLTPAPVAAAEAVIHFANPILASMIHGRWAIPPAIAA